MKERTFKMTLSVWHLEASDFLAVHWAVKQLEKINDDSTLHDLVVIHCFLKRRGVAFEIALGS